MNDVAANPPAPAAAASWSRNCWLLIIAFIFATHVALIFLFGEKKEVVPRAVADVPELTLANNSDELFSLENPTLFALPQLQDFAAVWQMPTVNQPANRYAEPPRWLPLPVENLGRSLGQFMQTNFPAATTLDFKPALEMTAPALAAEFAPTQNSTLKIEGQLAHRQLAAPGNLTNWPYADVIAPTKIQLLVSANGDVVSAILLPADNGFAEADQFAAADQYALGLARAWRFTPAANPAVGIATFNWHTVPPTASP
jgi:hypothetical protein